jgi:uncharacterized protein (TIGR03067 family)
MKLLRLAFPLLFMLFACAVRADDAKTFDGTWTPVEAMNAGEKEDEDYLKSITLKIDGPGYVVSVRDMKETGKFTFDDKKKPKTMDITPADGPNKEKVILAIYEVSGDTLKVCYDVSSKSRPSDFSSTKENKYFVVTYKRKK